LTQLLPVGLKLGLAWQVAARAQRTSLLLALQSLHKGG
jgi:hypothetical protein